MMNTHTVIGQDSAIEFAQLLASNGRKVYINIDTKDATKFYVRVGQPPNEGHPFGKAHIDLKLF